MDEDSRIIDGHLHGRFYIQIIGYVGVQDFGCACAVLIYLQLLLTAMAMYY